MYEKLFGVDPWQLYYIPDHFKTQEMCDKAVRDDALSLVCVLDWFVKRKQIGPWDDGDYCDDDKIIKWCEGYKEHKVQKVKLEGELIPIACHPSRWKDLCLSEDVKKETEKLW